MRFVLQLLSFLALVVVVMAELGRRIFPIAGQP